MADSELLHGNCIGSGFLRTGRHDNTTDLNTTNHSTTDHGTTHDKTTYR